MRGAHGERFGQETSPERDERSQWATFRARNVAREGHESPLEGGLQVLGDGFSEVLYLDGVRDGFGEGLETERAGGDYGLRVASQ